MQENTTSPSLKISDILYGGASLTVAGEMSFISDSLWEATFNVVAKVPHNRGIFSIELALNGRDYFKAAVVSSLRNKCACKGAWYQLELCIGISA